MVVRLVEITYEKAIELFEKCLQILHPFMPFISEEVWQGLRERSENEFLAIDSLFQPQELQSKGILDEMELISNTISSVKAFWNDQKSRGGGKGDLEVYIKTDKKEVFEKYDDILKKFLRTDSIHFQSEKPANSGSIRVGTTEIFIPLPEINKEEEIEKLKGEIAHQEGFLAKVNKKLSNERFVANAPEKVVAMEKKKQSDAEARLKVLRESLAELEG